MKLPYYLTVSALAALVVSCGKPEREVRAYREISLIADHAQSPNAPVSTQTETSSAPFAGGGMAGGMPSLPPEMQAPSLPLSWTTPVGWEAKPGSGMRIATWLVEGQECTLMSFPGDVGGDEANIRRWLGQLGQSADDAQLSAFSADPQRLATDSGLDVRLYDFSALLPANATKTILAAIIPVGDQSAFLKLMGDAEVLRRQKSAFEALCRSISLKTE